jgi:hypothetical protein
MHAITISMYRYDIKDKILGIANLDQHYLHVKESLQQHKLHKKIKDCELKEDGVLMYMGKVYVPKSQELTNLVLK